MGIKKNGIKKVLTGALALTMCLGASLATLAGTGGTPASPAEAKLRKTVSYADTLTTPNASFQFTFTGMSKDGLANSASQVPTITTQTLTFASTDTGTTAGGITSVTKNTNNLLAGITWTAAGTYLWNVVETPNTNTSLSAGEAIRYSSAAFELIVKVAYDSTTDSYYVESTQTNQTTNNDNTANTDGKNGADVGDEDGSGNSIYNFTFTNIYSKEAGGNPGGGGLGEGEDTTDPSTDGNESLAIRKVVENSVDASQNFAFSITLNDSAATFTRGTYVGRIYNGTVATGTTVSVVANGTAVPFNLRENQRLVFHDLPVGTVANVTETGIAGYTPAISGMVTQAGTVATTLSTGNQTLKTGENVITFTNTFDNTNIPTGVLANNLPFIALIGAGVLAVALYTAVKKRQAMR